MSHNDDRQNQRTFGPWKAGRKTMMNETGSANQEESDRCPLTHHSEKRSKSRKSARRQRDETGKSHNGASESQVRSVRRQRSDGKVRDRPKVPSKSASRRDHKNAISGDDTASLSETKTSHSTEGIDKGPHNPELLPPSNVVAQKTESISYLEQMFGACIAPASIKESLQESPINRDETDRLLAVESLSIRDSFLVQHQKPHDSLMQAVSALGADESLSHRAADPKGYRDDLASKSLSNMDAKAHEGEVAASVSILTMTALSSEETDADDTDRLLSPGSFSIGGSTLVQTKKPDDSQTQASPPHACAESLLHKANTTEPSSSFHRNDPAMSAESLQAKAPSSERATQDQSESGSLSIGESLLVQHEKPGVSQSQAVTRALQQFPHNNALPASLLNSTGKTSPLETDEDCVDFLAMFGTPSTRDSFRGRPIPDYPKQQARASLQSDEAFPAAPHCTAKTRSFSLDDDPQELISRNNASMGFGPNGIARTFSEDRANVTKKSGKRERPNLRRTQSESYVARRFHSNKHQKGTQYRAKKPDRSALVLPTSASPTGETSSPLETDEDYADSLAMLGTISIRDSFRGRPMQDYSQQQAYAPLESDETVPVVHKTTGAKLSFLTDPPFASAPHDNIARGGIQGIARAYSEEGKESTRKSGTHKRTKVRRSRSESSVARHMHSGNNPKERHSRVKKPKCSVLVPPESVQHESISKDVVLEDVPSGSLESMTGEASTPLETDEDYADYLAMFGTPSIRDSFRGRPIPDYPQQQTYGFPESDETVPVVHKTSGTRSSSLKNVPFPLAPSDKVPRGCTKQRIARAYPADKTKSAKKSGTRERPKMRRTQSESYVAHSKGNPRERHSRVKKPESLILVPPDIVSKDVPKESLVNMAGEESTPLETDEDYADLLAMFGTPSIRDSFRGRPMPDHSQQQQTTGTRSSFPADAPFASEPRDKVPRVRTRQGIARAYSEDKTKSAEKSGTRERPTMGRTQSESYAARRSHSRNNPKEGKCRAKKPESSGLMPAQSEVSKPVSNKTVSKGGLSISLLNTTGETSSPPEDEDYAVFLAMIGSSSIRDSFRGRPIPDDPQQQTGNSVPLSRASIDSGTLALSGSRLKPDGDDVSPLEVDEDYADFVAMFGSTSIRDSFRGQPMPDNETLPRKQNPAGATSSFLEDTPLTSLPRDTASRDHVKRGTSRASPDGVGASGNNSCDVARLGRGARKSAKTNRRRAHSEPSGARQSRSKSTSKVARHRSETSTLRRASHSPATRKKFSTKSRSRRKKKPEAPELNSAPNG